MVRFHLFAPSYKRWLIFEFVSENVFRIIIISKRVSAFITTIGIKGTNVMQSHAERSLLYNTYVYEKTSFL